MTKPLHKKLGPIAFRLGMVMIFSHLVLYFFFGWIDATLALAGSMYCFFSIYIQNVESENALLEERVEKLEQQFTENSAGNG